MTKSTDITSITSEHLGTSQTMRFIADWQSPTGVAAGPSDHGLQHRQQMAADRLASALKGGLADLVYDSLPKGSIKMSAFISTMEGIRHGLKDGQFAGSVVSFIDLLNTGAPAVANTRQRQELGYVLGGQITQDIIGMFKTVIPKTEIRGLMTELKNDLVTGVGLGSLPQIFSVTFAAGSGTGATTTSLRTYHV